jgi:hypothetical protein
MFTYQIPAGTTDVSVVIRIVDSTDGTPETGVVFNTSGIDIEYRREGAASTDITEATLAGLTTAHTDGGFLHIGNGYYRVDLPDAACASGVSGVLVHGTVTGMIVIGCYIQLSAQMNANVTQYLGNAVPAADTAGYPKVTIKNGTGTGELALTSGNVALTSAGNTAVVTELMGTTTENNGSLTFKTLMRVLTAVLAGRVAISGSTVTFSTPNNGKVRATVVTDSSNQRTSVTLDGTD